MPSAHALRTCQCHAHACAMLTRARFVCMHALSFYHSPETHPLDSLPTTLSQLTPHRSLRPARCLACSSMAPSASPALAVEAACQPACQATPLPAQLAAARVGQSVRARGERASPAAWEPSAESWAERTEGCTINSRSLGRRHQGKSNPSLSRSSSPSQLLATCRRWTQTCASPVEAMRRLENRLPTRVPSPHVCIPANSSNPSVRALL